MAACAADVPDFASNLTVLRSPIVQDAPSRPGDRLLFPRDRVAMFP